MKISKAKIRQIIKKTLTEAYVQVYRRTGFDAELMPDFERAPNNLSKDFLEKFMLKSFGEHRKRISQARPDMPLSVMQQNAFMSARADVLEYIYNILNSGPLKSDAPSGEKPGSSLTDKTRRSQLIFTTNDYEDLYDSVRLYKNPRTGEEYYVNQDGHPVNPDPKLLPGQSFERVVKSDQEDLMSVTKGSAIFDSSPNAKAIDDYVNRVVQPTDTPTPSSPDASEVEDDVTGDIFGEPSGEQSVSMIYSDPSIQESIVQFPVQARKKELLSSLKQEFISNYDQSDPVMAEQGFESWADQVDNAITYVDKSTGDDLRKIDMHADEAFDMLMHGEFHPAAIYGSMTKAPDVVDLDDEFADFIDGIESGEVTDMFSGDDYDY